jgi:hypothetical protein
MEFHTVEHLGDIYISIIYSLYKREKLQKLLQLQGWGWLGLVKTVLII